MWAGGEGTPHNFSSTLYKWRNNLQLFFPTRDSELQPSSVRVGEDFTADFTFVLGHFFNNFQLN